MIPLDDARAFVLGGCEPLPPSARPLSLVHGLVLAEDVVSTEAVPAFANTAMDGFALRSSDSRGASSETPRRLRIVGTVAAGQVSPVDVEPGTAIRIMTGAPVPDGSDAVVMVERTRIDPAEPDVVEVLAEVEPGNHLRAAGDDITVGQTVFLAGEELSPGHLGVLASIGVETVVTGARVRVGVFSTGDELVPAGQPLGPGQIHDSNRLALLAASGASGFEAVDLGLVRDDGAAIEAAIRAGAATCDALITTGGVSMGDFDFVKVVLDRIGSMRWMQVEIKPAKPLAFGTVEGPSRRVPVFGLPGNPVSSMVSFELFARPGLRRMAGHPDHRLHRPTVLAVAAEPIRRRTDGKVHFVRVVGEWSPTTGRLEVRSAGSQGSHQLTALAHAAGLAVLPDGDGVDAGGDVEVFLWRDPRA